MKVKVSVLSLLSFLLLPIERLILLIETWKWQEMFCVSLFVATIELLLKKLPGEDIYVFTAARVLILLVMVVFYGLGFSSGAACVLMYGLLFVCYCYYGFQRLEQLRPLFKQQSVVISIESHAMLLYGIAVGLLMMVYILAWDYPLLYYLICALLLVLYIFLFVRIAHDRSIVLRRYKEIMLSQLAKGTLRPYSAGKSAQDVPKMSVLYQKIVTLLEDTEPYLDPDYGINDLARDVFTNKTYLSKTINVVSGRNFRQFINYYRVRHSIKVMTENPKLTVEEIAKSSGFHSTVTFNMAFKFNVGDTPGEYCQKLKSKLTRKTLP